MTRPVPPIIERCFIAFLCLLVAIPTGWGLWTYFTIDHSDDSKDWVVRVFTAVVMEIVGISFVLSVLGIVRALFRPHFLERFFKLFWNRWFTAIAIFTIVVLGMLAYGLILTKGGTR
jgi:hypothetical protein